jgi:hypothetical protein
VPRPEFLQETLQAYMAHIRGGYREGYGLEGLELLVRHIWGDGCAGRLDFSVLGTLELARKHTWTNLRANPGVTLSFFQPPAVSFEVRGTVEVHEDGPYHALLNAQHDVYHRPAPERWPARPAYLVRIREIYDNSASREGFGTLLTP